ncbi:iron chelate uptake ABC transporter family permease subunit [Gulosibacter sp. GYB002]|uniref:iron chelate uptake ABC transporter family permease subunit n=1 Tax=Gulosibacter sp. GYB002 TaxID=2994391 RepID=UPI002F96D604
MASLSQIAVNSRHSGSTAGAAQRANQRRDLIVMVVLAVFMVALIAAYLLVDLSGNVDYVLGRRLRSIWAFALVAIAIGISTATFQTITANRLLTPSIMGFDSLYILLQTVIVFLIGGTATSVFGTVGSFWLEVGCMVIFAVLLYSWLLHTQVRVHTLLLIGVVLGMLFRSVSTFLQRMIDPDTFMTLQNTFFASFTNVPKELLLPASVLLVMSMAVSWYDHRRLDVMALGVPVATNLGISPRAMRVRTLTSVALSVSVATALVGPVTFFGLIVVHLAYRMLRVSHHATMLPTVALIGMIALVGGQLLVERVFQLDIALAMIVEFVGGLLFIVLILRRKPL